MEMCALQDVAGRVLGYGRIAKLFFPIGGVGQSIFCDIPLKNNVRCLIHDNLMPVKTHTEFFLHSFLLCDVYDNTIEILRSVRVFYQLAFIHDPHQAAIFAGNPVL